MHACMLWFRSVLEASCARPLSVWFACTDVQYTSAPTLNWTSLLTCGRAVLATVGSSFASSHYGCVGHQGSQNFFVGVESCTSSVTARITSLVQKCGGDTSNAVVVKCQDLGLSMDVLVLETNTPSNRAIMDAGVCTSCPVVSTTCRSTSE